MIIHPASQLTDGWEKIKKGRPSASNFDKIITAAKGDLSKSHRAYIAELIAESFCPEFQSFTGNRWTERGLEFEPEARQAFVKHTGLSVVEVGFVTRDDTIVGCSPDFLVADAQGNYIAGGEMKCPIPATHVGYVLDGKLPDDYKQQVHGGMAVTGLNQWHFWSYFPGMQPFHLIVHRDEYTEKLSRSLDEFVILYQQAREKVIPKLRIVREDAQ